MNTALSLRCLALRVWRSAKCLRLQAQKNPTSSSAAAGLVQSSLTSPLRPVTYDEYDLDAEANDDGGRNRGRGVEQASGRFG